MTYVLLLIALILYCNSSRKAQSDVAGCLLVAVLAFAGLWWVLNVGQFMDGKPENKSVPQVELPPSERPSNKPFNLKEWFPADTNADRQK
jgi:nitrogen fixation-related uncharacterized protein